MKCLGRGCISRQSETIRHSVKGTRAHTQTCCCLATRDIGAPPLVQTARDGWQYRYERESALRTFSVASRDRRHGAAPPCPHKQTDRQTQFVRRTHFARSQTAPLLLLEQPLAAGASGPAQRRLFAWAPSNLLMGPNYSYKSCLRLAHLQNRLASHRPFYFRLKSASYEVCHFNTIGHVANSNAPTTQCEILIEQLLVSSPTF